MCWKDTCTTCGKATWAGWGLHIDYALREVSEEGRCSGWRSGKCTLLPVLDHEDEDYYSHLIGGVHDGGGEAEEGGWRRSRVQGDVFGSATRSSSVGKVCSGGGGECCGPCKYTCPDCGKEKLLLLSFVVLSRFSFVHSYVACLCLPILHNSSINKEWQCKQVATHCYSKWSRHISQRNRSWSSYLERVSVRRSRPGWFKWNDEDEVVEVEMRTSYTI